MKKLYKMKAITKFYNAKTQKWVEKDEILMVEGSQKQLLQEMKYAVEVKDEKDSKRIFL